MLAGFLFDRFAGEAASAVAFSRKRCLRSRFNKNECRACLDECRAGALELDGRSIAFEVEKCTGCMRCTAVCPNDAFATDLDMLQLLKNVRAQKTVVLSCRTKEQFVPHERIRCIGAFSALVLAAMNSLAKGKIFLDATQCNKCYNGHCLEETKRLLATLCAHNTASDKAFSIKLVPDEAPFPEIDYNTSRRFFLKGTGRAITDLGIEAYGKARCKNEAENQDSLKGPVQNSVILRFAFDHASEDAVKKNLEPFLYTVEADEHCNLCPVCSGMCPTGALKRVQENSEKHLVFKSSDCSGCGLCRDFCKKQALSIRKGFSGNIKEVKQLN